MAGLVTAGLVAFLLSGTELPPASTAVPATVKKPAPMAVQKKASPHKRMTKKKAPAKSKRIVPVVKPVGLLVTFPKPTDITIVLAKAPQYVKIDHANGELHESISKWDCVEDKSTGLIWEKKTQGRGLRDAANFYSWYDPNTVSNGGNVGAPDNGKCRGGINCDTDSYIKAVNKLKLCGYSDWRLPTRADLMSLVQYSEQSKGKGLIERRFFPTATSDWYWAADTDELNPERAWYVLFFNGRRMKASKFEAKRIRLVRTQSQRSMRNMAQKTTTVAAERDSLIASKPAVKSGASDS